MSMFGFLRNSAKDKDTDINVATQSNDDQPTQMSSELVHEQSSAFSFMTHEVGNQHDNDEPSSSSFSFLAQSDNSSFSFLNSESAQQVQSTEKLSAPVAVTTGVPLMSKTVANKAVKKKKRASRVGFARGDDDDEDQVSAPVAVPRTSLLSVQEVSGDHDQGEEDGPRPSLSDAATSEVEQSATIHVSSTPSSSTLSAFDFLSTQSLADEPAVEAEATAVPTQTSTTNSTLSETHAQPSAETSSFNFLSTSSSLSPDLPDLPDLPAIAVDETPTVVLSIDPPATATDATATAALEDSEGDRIRAQSKDNVATLERLVGELSDVQHSAVSEHRRIRLSIDVANKDIVDLKARLAGLESEQVKLAQQEEFERADGLNAVIDSTTLELQRKVKETVDLKILALSNGEKFSARRAALLSSIQRATSNLQSISEQLTYVVQNDASVLAFEHEQARLRTEEERLAMEKSHFEREEEALSNELNATEDAIRTQSGDFCVKKETAEIGLLSVQSEIRQLEQLLAAKREEEASLVKELSWVESKINEVRKKYERQLQRIHDRSQALGVTKQEYLEEELALHLEKDRLTASMVAIEEAHSAAKQWDSSVAVDAELMGGFLHSSAVEGDGSTLSYLGLLAAIPACEANTDEFSALQSQLDKTNVDLVGAQASLNDLEQQMEALTTESRSISEQIPKLEVEKKSHALGKRFKEAAAVAKDIKDFHARKEELDGEVHSIGQLIDEQAALVVECSEKYQSALDQVKNAQREVELRRLDLLVSRAKRLRKEERELGKSVAAKEALSLVFDGRKDIAQAVKSFVQAELRAVEEEAELISMQYSSSRSLEELLLEDDNEPEDTPVSEEMTSSLPSADSPAEGNTLELGLSAAFERSTEQDESEGSHSLSESASVADSAAGVDVAQEGVAEHTEQISEEELVAQNAAVRLDRIRAAQSLRAKIAQLNDDLEAATASEEYEQAAQLHEESTAAEDELSALLGLIGLDTAEELDNI